MQPRHQATLTQPLQCVWQHHVANLHVSTHVATPDDNNHAAIPVRSATTDSRHAYKYAQEQPLVAGHRWGTHSWMKRPQPQPPHTRGTFHRRLQPLYAEKHKVSCSGFLPNTRPIARGACNIHAAITMRFAASRRKPVYLCTWQHQMTTIMQPFHCDLQPQIQDTHTNTHRNNHSLQNTEGNAFADETTGAVTAAHI